MEIAHVSVKVARFGNELTIIDTWVGKNTFPRRRYFKIDLMEIVRLVEGIVWDFKRIGFSSVHTTVDGRGLGGGLVDQLKHLGYDVTETRPLSNEKRLCNHCGYPVE